MEKYENTKLNTFDITVLVLLVVSVVSYIAYTDRVVMREYVYNTLNDFKLIPRPERFTELYFENASALPKQTEAGKPISFSFTIHNLEGITMRYPYKVYFEYPSGGRYLLSTTTEVILEHGAFATMPVSYTFHSSAQQGKVVVELTSRNQSIDFLLPNTNQ